MNFTANQRSAIERISGNLQLIACAGSRKTEVVAQRVVSLLRPIASGGAACTPENVVAFTFTDKAAAERWCRAVTNDGRFGICRYYLCFGQSDLEAVLSETNG